MLLTRFDPFKELRSLEKRIGEAFSSDLSKDVFSSFTPSVNTREGEYAYHIDVDLPGVKKEDISVKVENGVLTLKGERKEKNEVKKEDYYQCESNFGSFIRSFTLPSNVDTENIHAENKDGVLEVTLPKKESKDDTVKQIKVK
ncbi:MAG: Hsp20/alpha crystallin family protein [Sulfuricurvum sp.]|uniref:Hsp20/alpha crystallin family protein n=1 Tax=Sulfuricurvum sp. TaxID=2025608 RepID=UPI00261FB489|nr:Hsp20/alpha crystallin family protein [Sulfuricurvum sp.]MDD2950567.1 Hsp20/alpha crystallin family protein [Sulfuricurvum sp.]MDD5117652.1 Hsp20/alpha crystallin family protein [Sulfuricurvum sp.]